MEVTLRGLRIEPHPKNPAGLAGAVVAWERVEIGDETAAFAEDGGEMGGGGRSCRVPLDVLRRQVARRAQARARARRVSAPGFRLEVHQSVGVGTRLMGGLLLASVLVLMAMVAIIAAPIVRSASGLSAGWTALAWGAGLTFMMFPIGFGLVVWRDAWAMIRPQARRVVFTHAGVEAELMQGRVVSGFWRDLRGARFSLNHAALDFADGLRLRVQLIKESRPIIKHWRRRADPDVEERERARLRGALARSFAWFQLGGVAMGYAAWRLGLPGPGGAWSPVLMYLGVGFGYPLGACLQMWGKPALAKGRLRLARRRRTRERAAGRAAGDHPFAAGFATATLETGR